MGVVTQLPHAAAERARAKSFLVYIPAACLAPFCLTGVQVVFVVSGVAEVKLMPGPA